MNRTIPITQFRNQCLRLMDEVKATGDTLIVTKHGRPLAAVIPVVDERSRSIIGWSSEIRLGDDLTNPAIPPDDWEIVSQPDRIATSLRGE
nr:type II toxin-antitoxin system Phd/YefM family antitoxin [bacterium]